MEWFERVSAAGLNTVRCIRVAPWWRQASENMRKLPTLLAAHFSSPRDDFRFSAGRKIFQNIIRLLFQLVLGIANFFWLLKTFIFFSGKTVRPFYVAPIFRQVAFFLTSKLVH